MVTEYHAHKFDTYALLVSYEVIPMNLQAFFVDKSSEKMVFNTEFNIGMYACYRPQRNMGSRIREENNTAVSKFLD